MEAELTHAPPPHTARDCLTPPLSGFGGGAFTTEPLLLMEVGVGTVLLVIATMFLVANSPKTVVGVDRWCAKSDYGPVTP